MLLRSVGTLKCLQTEKLGVFDGKYAVSKTDCPGVMAGWSKFVLKRLQIGILNPPYCSSGATQQQRQPHAVLLV